MQYLLCYMLYAICHTTLHCITIQISYGVQLHCAYPNDHNPVSQVIHAFVTRDNTMDAQGISEPRLMPGTCPRRVLRRLLSPVLLCRTFHGIDEPRQGQ